MALSRKYRLPRLETGTCRAILSCICVTYAVSRLIVVFMPEWWYSVDYAIRQCTALLMCVQGIATIEDYLRKTGMRRGLRGTLLFIAVLVFRTFVIFMGVISALIGWHSMISDMDKQSF